MKNLALVFALALFGPIAAGQPPTKETVPLVSVGGPGGFNSQIVLALQPVISQVLSAQVPIEYKTGSNGAIALQYLTTSAKDRNIIMIGPWFPNPNVNLVSDVKPVLHFGESSLMLYVRADVKAKSLADLLTNKSKLTIGSSVPGSIDILVRAMQKQYPKHDIVAVPYRSGAEAITAVLGGHIDVGVTPAPVLLPFVNDNKLLPIGNISTGRSPLFPNVNTIQEQTAWKLEGYPYLSWFMYTSLGTDDQIVAKLKTNFSIWIQTPEGKSFLEKFDLVISPKTFVRPELVLKNLQTP